MHESVYVLTMVSQVKHENKREQKKPTSFANRTVIGGVSLSVHLRVLFVSHKIQITKGMYKQWEIPLPSSMSHSCQPEIYKIHQALTRLPVCNCCALASPNVLRLPCTQLPLSCDTKSVPSIASYNQVHCHCHCAFVMRSAIVQRLWLS